LHEQSHGESFLALFGNRLRGGGLYIVDEPEAALSPTRQLSLLVMLHDLVKQGAQFLIATHSPILMAYPEARIFLLLEDTIEQVAYTETDHYSTTKAFLNDHQAMLRRLLGKDAV
jgi:predicted ATPase